MGRLDLVWLNWIGLTWVDGSFPSRVFPGITMMVEGSCHRENSVIFMLGHWVQDGVAGTGSSEEG